jgi:hypothetical protein
MTLINITTIPEEVAGPLVELEAALADRRYLQSRVAEAAAAVPEYARALDAARAALTEARADWALATDETEKKFRSVHDRKRSECSEAEAAFERSQELPGLLMTRAAEKDRNIMTAKAAFDAACRPFCDGVLAEWRKLYGGSVHGGGVALKRVLQLGYALCDSLPFAGTLRSTLQEVNLPDIGPAPGRPRPHLIQGERCWSDDDDDVAGTSLRHWQDDPDIIALHALLKPVHLAYTAARREADRIETERRRAEAAARTAPMVPPEPPKMSSEEFLASQPTLEEHRAIMRGYAAESTKGITPPAQVSYSEGQRRFDGVRLA